MGQNLGQQRLPLAFADVSVLGAAEGRAALVVRFQITGRLFDQRERQVVTGFVVISPVDQAVAAQDDADAARIGRDRLSKHQAQVEARSLPIDPDDRVAVNLAGKLPPIAAGSDGDDGVGVAVIDMPIGDEGVQRRVDRAGARIQVVDAMRVHGDHGVFDWRLDALDFRRVVDVLQLHQLVPVKRGEVFALAGAQVATRALDKHDVHIRARQRIDLRDFAGGVAAAGVGDALVGAEQVGAVDQPFYGVERVGAGLIPQVIDMAVLGWFEQVHTFS